MERNKWFPFETYKNKVDLKMKNVFCFSHAGGSAATYRKWTLKKQGINIITVELPGVGSRRKEEFIYDYKDFIDELAIEIQEKSKNCEFYFFGHSMGAALAFYLAKHMQDKNLKIPKKIVVAGRQPPNEENEIEFKTYMDDQALIDELKRYEATPKELLENEEFLNIVIQDLRKAYTLNESYIYNGEKINIDIVAHSGISDFEANNDIMSRWANVTNKDFKIKEFDGNHFFIFNLGDEYEDNLLKEFV